MMLNTDTIQIPTAEAIDYTDPEEVYAYSLLLGRLLESHAGLNAPSKNDSALIRSLKAEGKYWLTQVKRLLTEGALSATPDLLETYIFFNLVCCGRKDTDFCNKVRLNAVKQWLGGDKTLTETQIVCLLWPMVSSDPQNTDPRYAKYCSACLNTWVKELQECGHFNGITDTEAYQRLNYVLNHDLFAFIAGGQEAERTAKLQWAKAYEVDDISSLGTAALKAYIPFARTLSSFKQTPREDREAEYVTLSEELASRTDLHPLHRESIRIGISNRRILLAGLSEEIARSKNRKLPSID